MLCDSCCACSLASVDWSHVASFDIVKQSKVPFFFALPRIRSHKLPGWTKIMSSTALAQCVAYLPTMMHALFWPSS